MHWLTAHLYLAALAVIAVTLTIGAFFLKSQMQLSPQAEPSAWGGSFGPPGASAPYTPPRVVPDAATIHTSAPYTYTPPEAGTTNATQAPGDSFDFNGFVSMLLRTSASTEVTPTQVSASDTGSAYAYIPSGLWSAPSQKTRTAAQQALYEYGNEVGSFVQSFETQYPAMAQILKDQAEDRSNAAKAQALKTLAGALGGLGNSLLTVDTVPASAASFHSALAKSYQELGKKLAAVADARSDADFVAAIQAYDASADIFVKNFVALAQLFVAQGVSFGSADAGSVFSFSSN